MVVVVVVVVVLYDDDDDGVRVAAAKAGIWDGDDHIWKEK